jgi:hypothetical protein
MTTKNTEAASLSFQSDKEIARREFHDRRELETNEHDFAFLDGFDAGYAAAKEEAWHLIRSEDDLPKVEGEYDVTNMGGKVETGHRISRSSVDNDFWLDNYIAWKPKTAPYTEPQTGGKDD